MAGLVLDGKALSLELEAQLKARVLRLGKATGEQPPVLATILVGDDPASATYVRMKGNACRRVGMESWQVTLAADTTTEQVLTTIDGLNRDARVRGILLQHPVPDQVDERLCFDRIALDKDVDGVTSHGFGRMVMKQQAFGSATPAGIMHLLRHYGIALEGRSATVVGRSAILGKPMAMMLNNANATVTLCHRYTVDLPRYLRDADVVVAALGKREYLRAEWLKDGVVAVDAGYHPGGVGDIEMTPLIDRCAAYTPVPGGVGPMTIATLIGQTVESAERAAGMGVQERALAGQAR